MSGINKDTDDSNFFIRFFKYFIPWKGDRVGEIFRKIVFIGSIVLFATSLNDLTSFLETDKETIEYAEQIQALEPDFDDEISYGTTTGEDLTGAAPTKEKRVVQDWAKSLVKRTDEAVGWIKIPGFVDSNGKEYINFPVVQHEDNDYYLTHNIDGDPYESGSIYADYVIPIDEEGQPNDIVIYGHHMRKLGTSFTHLAEYKESVKLLKKCPIIEFNTIYETGQEYIIIGCFIGAKDESQDNNHLFDYWRYRNFNNTDRTFSKWLKNVEKASWYSCDVQCDPDDDYITLSTCSNEAGDSELRWVMVAKKLDSDDDKDAIIASYKEKKDKDIYFPQLWIDTWGNQKKYLGWSY